MQKLKNRKMYAIQIVILVKNDDNNSQNTSKNNY